jgi:hypothetical protein
LIPKILQDWSADLRRRRDQRFRHLFRDLIDQGCTILDVGGEPYYWEVSIGPAAEHYRRCRITLLNPKQQTSRLPNVACIVGDGTDMSTIPDRSYDIVLSNAVIEHVGDFEAQRRFADHVQRVGRYFFVHSPNYYFPVEPHSFFPFFNQLPFWMQVLIARVWPGQSHIRDFSPKSIKYLRTKVRLLKLREVKELFPHAKIETERVMGVVKSYIVHNAP